LLLNDKPLFNSSLVFREDHDNWGALYDPDSGNVFALNPVGSFILQRLDGKHSISDIIAELRENCDDMPDNAESLIESFLKDLAERGFIGYETKL